MTEENQIEIKYVKGDATWPAPDDKTKVILHCCNDLGGWGSGFVVALSNRYLNVDVAYRNWFHQTGAVSPFDILYESSKVPGLGEIQVLELSPKLLLCNMIGQHGVGHLGVTPPIRYEAFEQGFQALNDFFSLMDITDASIHCPRLGCGLAGGDWAKVSDLLMEHFVSNSFPVTVYDLE